MTVLDLVSRAAVGWCVVAIIVVGAFAVAAVRHKQRQGRKIHGAYPDCVPVPLPVPPRITQEQVDETWASVWPSYVEPADIDTLEQRVFDRLFDDLIAIEGLS